MESVQRKTHFISTNSQRIDQLLFFSFIPLAQLCSRPFVCCTSFVTYWKFSYWKHLSSITKSKWFPVSRIAPSTKSVTSF